MSFEKKAFAPAFCRPCMPAPSFPPWNRTASHKKDGFHYYSDHILHRRWNRVCHRFDCLRSSTEPDFPCRFQGAIRKSVPMQRTGPIPRVAICSRGIGVDSRAAMFEKGHGSNLAGDIALPEAHLLEPAIRCDPHSSREGSDFQVYLWSCGLRVHERVHAAL